MANQKDLDMQLVCVAANGAYDDLKARGNKWASPGTGTHEVFMAEIHDKLYDWLVPTFDTALGEVDPEATDKWAAAIQDVSQRVTAARDRYLTDVFMRLLYHLTPLIHPQS